MDNQYKLSDNLFKVITSQQQCPYIFKKRFASSPVIPGLQIVHQIWVMAPHFHMCIFDNNLFKVISSHEQSLYI